MLRIGMVGSDNSHAIAFSRLCNLPKDEDGLHVGGARVTHLFGLDDARNREVAEKGRIPAIVADPKEMIGHVDGVHVCFRHGDLHLKYALPFLKAGIPTFVDKPLACRVADAKRLIAAAQQSGAPLTSFSTVRLAKDMVAWLKGVAKVRPLNGGAVFGPADADSQYGGLIFYGIHTVELMLEVFGYDVTAVRAVKSDLGVFADCVYQDGAIVSLEFVKKGATGFGLLVHGQKQHLYHMVDGGTAYRDGFVTYLKMFKTGEWPLTAGQLLRPVELMDAIARASTSGREVRVPKMQ
jgi:predicted dehydrogenase